VLCACRRYRKGAVRRRLALAPARCEPNQHAHRRQAARVSQGRVYQPKSWAAAAGVSTWATHMTGLAMYDAIGSITIGLLLGCTAVFLIGQNRSLLIGARAPCCPVAASSARNGVRACVTVCVTHTALCCICDTHGLCAMFARRTALCFL